MAFSEKDPRWAVAQTTGRPLPSFPVKTPRITISDQQAPIANIPTTFILDIVDIDQLYSPNFCLTPSLLTSFLYSLLSF